MFAYCCALICFSNLLSRRAFSSDNQNDGTELNRQERSDSTIPERSEIQNMDSSNIPSSSNQESSSNIPETSEIHNVAESSNNMDYNQDDSPTSEKSFDDKLVEDKIIQLITQWTTNTLSKNKKNRNDKEIKIKEDFYKNFYIKLYQFLNEKNKEADNKEDADEIKLSRQFKDKVFVELKTVK